jgi:anti-sigma factor RsiW
MRHMELDLLSAYLDRELDRDELEHAELHLGQCLHCRQRLDGLRRVAGALGALGDVMPPPSLGEAVARQVRLEAEERGLMARLRMRHQAARRAPAHLFVSFTLVAALAVILYVYVDAVERHERRPILIALPAQTQIHSLALDRANSALPLLLWRDGNGWREEGLEDGVPFRRIAPDSAEAGEIFAEIPGLQSLVLEEQVPVLLRRDGAIVLMLPDT